MKKKMEIEFELRRARKFAGLGKKREAREVLRGILAVESRNEQAWILFADVSDKPADKVRCLKNVLKLNPSNEDCRNRLGSLKQYLTVQEISAFGLEAIQSKTIAPAESKPAPIETIQAPAQNITPANAMIIGRAGKSTREMAEQRQSQGIKFAVFGIAGFIFIGLVLQGVPALTTGAFGVIALLIFIFLPKFIEAEIDSSSKKMKRADRGAKGEEDVGEILAELGDGYYVLHDVRCPNGNIDHIVLGETAGIFLIETKSHGGKVVVQKDTLLVNGKPPEKDFIAQTNRNTYWLRDAIKEATGCEIWIRSVIVFTNAFLVPGKPIKGVAIINKKYLLAMLRKASGDPQLDRMWEMRDKIIENIT
jgi:hypothetical protein